MKTFLWAGRKIRIKNLELLEELKSEFDIKIVSDQTHNRVLEEIKNCYAVILPSYSEVCPNFVLEAASLGKPFIMTTETGLKEITSDGGIFVNPFDKEALKQAMRDMLEQSKYDVYKEALRNIKPRSWETVAKKFINLCK